MSAKYQVKPGTPPPAANSNVGGKLYHALLEVMQYGPQDGTSEKEGFFQVATYGSRSSAASTVTNIKNGNRRIPEGRWIFTSNGHVATNTSVLWAKYLGPEES